MAISSPGKANKKNQGDRIFALKTKLRVEGEHYKICIAVGGQLPWSTSTALPALDQSRWGQKVNFQKSEKIDCELWEKREDLLNVENNKQRGTVRKSRIWSPPNFTCPVNRILCENICFRCRMPIPNKRPDTFKKKNYRKGEDCVGQTTLELWGWLLGKNSILYNFSPSWIFWLHASSKASNNTVTHYGLSTDLAVHSSPGSWSHWWTSVRSR